MAEAGNIAIITEAVSAYCESLPSDPRQLHTSDGISHNVRVSGTNTELPGGCGFDLYNARNVL